MRPLAALAVLVCAALSRGQEPPAAWTDAPPAAWGAPAPRYCDCNEACDCPKDRCPCTAAAGCSQGCKCDKLPRTCPADDGGPDWIWDDKRRDWWRKVSVERPAPVPLPVVPLSLYVPPPLMFRPMPPPMMRGGGGC